MIERLVLTRDEICELVGATLQYNRKRPTNFAFILSNGQQLLDDFVVEFECESDPLRVRNVPETEDNPLPSIASPREIIEGWRKHQTAK